MNKKLRNIIAGILISASLVTIKGTANVYAANNPIPQNTQLWCIKTNVQQNKEWTINFNKQVDICTLAAGVHIYDKDSKDLPLTIYVSLDRKSIKIDVDPGTYQKNNTYDLYIKGITSGNKVLNSTWMEFTIEK